MNNNRLLREKKTLGVMIGMYCHDHHGTRGEMCNECAVLWVYAQKRLLRCPFGEEKPTCAHCPVHCYKPVMRDKVRAIMRYAGPRMLWRHPVLAFWHVVDGLNKTIK